MRKSYIYFIQIADLPDSPIKIGITSSPLTHRLKTLQIGCPYPLHVLAIHRFTGKTCEDKAINLEAKLHWTFRLSRRRGEWFTPTSELLEHIKTKATQPTVEDFGGACSSYQDKSCPLAAQKNFSTFTKFQEPMDELQGFVLSEGI